MTRVLVDCDPLSVFEKIQRFGCGDLDTTNIPKRFGFLKGGQPLDHLLQGSDAVRVNLLSMIGFKLDHYGRLCITILSHHVALF
jgi:hypothetical protein